MKFHIEADNPKGLAFDYLVTREQAPSFLRMIVQRGGTNIRINGTEVSEEKIAELTK